jgi:hypothetical protein
VLKIIAILILSYTALNFAQFDETIFSKQMYLQYNIKNVYALGDQNDDGFDDILVWECETKKLMIFFGGNPMSTIPAYEFNLNVYAYYLAPVDINDDQKKDLVILTKIDNQDVGQINIFYGGILLDTIPDIVFAPPNGASRLFNSIAILQDYNGDGRDEFMIKDAHLPYSNIQYGTFYIYNSEATFDTIPHVIFSGDTINNIRLEYNFYEGDINGDNKVDFTLTGIKYDDTTRFFRNFYIGNENWNMEPAVTYFDDEHSFEPRYMRIIEDINGDSRDDILIAAYSNVYPYWYHNSILYGSFPIDTVQDVGLNTQNTAIINVEKVGDVNGDGFNDLFTQFGFGYLSAKIWMGGGIMQEVPARIWWGGEEGMARRIAGVGDVDGDGVNDLSISKITYSGTGVCKLGTLFIFKGDTSVIGDTTTNVEQENIQEIKYKLENPFPNPFNPITTIKYSIVKAGKVKLVVYDILGREVIVLADEEKEPGFYEVNFDASHLSSGVYFYQLRSKYFVDTKKMILLR